MIEKHLSGSDKKEVRKIFAAIKKNIAAASRTKGKAFSGGAQVYRKRMISPCSVVYEIFDNEGTIRIDCIGRVKATADESFSE